MHDVDSSAYLNWLMNNAGPIIRFRIAAELIQKLKETKSAEKELLSSRLAQYWLENLKPRLGRNELHGSKTEAYENAMGKLYEFGFRRGMPLFDRKTEHFRRWLRSQINAPNEGYLPIFFRTLVASFLAMTGYGDDESVNTWLLRRLETIYAFAKKGNLEEAYVPQDTFPGFPKGFKNSPLLNPELYPDDELKLPWIHDLYGFLHSRCIMDDVVLRDRVETIIKFIFTPEYQKLRVGYGIVRHRGGRYYAMGWSIHLPRYFKSEVKSREFGRLLLLLDLLGRSNFAKSHVWYKQSAEWLGTFKDETGMISFPRTFLPENKIGVWVLGMRMGLEENRRTKRAITCESVFRFLKITSHAAQE